MTVEEGEDWKDVQIPAQTSGEAAPKPETEAAPAAPAKAEKKAVAGEHVFQHVPNVGPATNLLLAQYGIKAGLVVKFVEYWL